jgi:prlF antitoxin for toxin YhaV_toxin
LEHKNLINAEVVMPIEPESPIPHADPMVEDPEVARVLEMLERDILTNSEKLKPISQAMINRMVELADGVALDLDASLSPDDE